MLKKLSPLTKIVVLSFFVNGPMSPLTKGTYGFLRCYKKIEFKKGSGKYRKKKRLDV